MQAPTPQEIEVFLNFGWPKIQQIAGQKGIAPFELKKGFEEPTVFIVESFGPTARLAKFVRVHESTLNYLKWLDQTTKAGTKIKKAELHFVSLIIMALRDLQFSAVVSEINLNEEITVDYLNVNMQEPMTAERVERIFNSLEENFEEVILRLVMSDAEGENQNKDSNQNQIEFSKSPNSTQETSLLALLKSETALTEGQVYRYQNFQGHEFTIEFTDHIIKSANKGERKNIFRLLASLYKGNCSQSGLKFLFSTQEGLIEIKAMLHGHKRLLGCIKGRHIVIKEFYNIPASIAAYSHWIPSQFCK